MSGWEQIDHNPATGLKTFIASDMDDPDTVLVRHEQSGASLQAILDRNKAAQNERHGRMGDMEKAAEIPAIVMFEWLTKFGVNFYNPAHKDGVKKLLNSSDYRYLKCRNIII